MLKSRINRRNSFSEAPRRCGRAVTHIVWTGKPGRKGKEKDLVPRKSEEETVGRLL